MEDNIIKAVEDNNLLGYLSDLSGDELEVAMETISHNLNFNFTMKDEQGNVVPPAINVVVTNSAPARMTKGQLDSVIENKKLKGFKSNENGSLTKEVSFKMVPSEKRASTRSEDSYIPSEEEMVKINAITMLTWSPENARTFTFQAADDQVDRAYEHFHKQALKEMAEMAIKNEIPYLVEGAYDHQWTQKNVHGVVYDAQVKNGKLLYKVFVPVIDKTKGVLDAIYAGLYKKLSVGFALNYENFECDTCKKSMFLSDCTHWPGMPDEKGNIVTATIKSVADNFEVSGVAVPCQPEAAIRRTLSVEMEADMQAKTLNNNIFKKGGLVAPIVAVGGVKGVHKVEGEVPSELLKKLTETQKAITKLLGVPNENIPTSTINTESTIGNSVPMDESQVAVELEGAENPEAPAQEESTEAPAVEVEAPAEVTAVVEAQVAEPVAEVKLEIPKELTEALVAMSKYMESMDKYMESVDKKLDLAMSAPTKGLREEFAVEAPAPASKSRKLLSKFSLLQENDDLGGQE